MAAQVYWCALFERSMEQYGVAALLRVADHCGAQHYHQIQTPYQRTDAARNNIVAKFLEVATDPNDTLVMLDCDHIHPPDVVSQLVRHDPAAVGVVAAQAHRRGEPFDMCAFIRVDDVLHTIAEWEPNALIACAVVGTGAIAIRRWVFDKLVEAGINFPYFRYAYEEGSASFPTEDIYFGLACEHVGVIHWVDTSVQIPHLIASTVDQESWFEYMRAHPEKVKRLDEAVVVERQAPAEVQVPDLRMQVNV